MAYRAYVLADYHVHPDFSIDAVGNIDEHCRAALNKGLAEICFTTHYDNDPKIPAKVRTMRINGELHQLSDKTVKTYLDAVEKAHKKYFPRGLKVSAGIEVGWFPGCEKELTALFSKHAFDYKLVGLHDIGALSFCYHKQAEKCFSRYSPEEFADHYFSLIKDAVDSDLFDSVAHLDVYRRYGQGYYGEPILNIYRGRIEPIFEAMNKSGMGFEINTSAFRHGLDQFYPTMDIVNLARKMGVRVAAIGSDAHRPDDVGGDLDAAAPVAHELFPYCDE
ncbi:MAG: histidinol-phosphatase HisJ family protein [Candidatus Zixiibacteriota bacterium]|nr:MAG: histidinol-phosphatase HisJ family protein [candidate division Zixibacteria bacterium]